MKNLKQKITIESISRLSPNVLNAIDSIRASGAMPCNNTIDLMSMVDSGKLTEDEAIQKIIQDEGLIVI